ncbi:MBL fold metallo-hydrolase [Afifella sp. JA880]|uniref:MBL fold metallo-hydrolase n=1 Tax=Afifella sp. JA880 TaxID=2975280 RepID=UPI0021BAB23C|nr:MBL fold metallo-hydrolase [Afifella sp. JA880]MCT8267522.1 MBL fold metallo-hydrolase [Afifella sp. JA880]
MPPPSPLRRLRMRGRDSPAISRPVARSIAHTIGAAIIALAASIGPFGTAANAAPLPVQERTERQTPSRCLAIAEAAPPTLYASYRRLDAPARHLVQGKPFALRPPEQGEVTIRFVGHATFLIESPEGVTIATDYDGWAGGVTPDVVTMNHAHSSHYTDQPDPAIAHVLRGWNPQGGEAHHNLTVGDVLIRNVPTDIRSFGGRETAGNSIFIFETAGLCIGHLGHLHHVLAPEDLGIIGQLDVVMVAVDGSYTMSQDAVVETLKVLKSRLILPMHYFGMGTLQRFLSRLGEDFAVEINPSAETTVSVATLPLDPKVLVLPGH